MLERFENVSGNCVISVRLDCIILCFTIVYFIQIVFSGRVNESNVLAWNRKTIQIMKITKTIQKLLRLNRNEKEHRPGKVKKKNNWIFPKSSKKLFVCRFDKKRRIDSYYENNLSRRSQKRSSVHYC